jgi:hypothetical protein
MQARGRRYHHYATRDDGLHAGTGRNPGSPQNEGMRCFHLVSYASLRVIPKIKHCVIFPAIADARPLSKNHVSY